MGQPLPTTATPAAGTPPTGDKANAYVAGTFTAVGQVSAPFCFYGPFNISIWPSLSKSLTSQTGGTTATVSVGTGLGKGQNISSSALPLGANIADVTGSLAGITTIQIGGLTTAQYTGLTGTNDPAAIFVGNGITADADVVLERSFDGGSTWLAVSTDKIGTPALFQLASGHLTYPVSVTYNEPEVYAAYRLHCPRYVSGTINYRFSATGAAATTWAPPGP